ncbi:MAG: MetQ/NlpA family ABC transporter substrate-binding protein [Anaerolineales bacterium]|nr:MetQ/NlpA family ABC transporter substrate-binding protein [Anaerolineales bacterium]MCX7754934.1 MetQ/NlpA family ABC transporter substrate-binding protein [Anaerolineales bacterium]MDW8277311.1 ABC transporter substrate-binding protein [Anaerolineales bacterium]
MKRLPFLFFLLSLLLSACGAATPADDVTVRIAVIPVIDTLPMFVAEAEGLYTKHGVKVELIPVGSAPERDQLLQAGQADGTLNELLSVMLFNREKIQMQAVRYGHMASEGAGHFFLLASGQSGITDVEQLKGVEIGISQGTIIEYLTDRLLEAEGFSSADIKYVAVPKISDRMALLASGELKAAVMPDPLGGLAVQQGAVVLLDDSSYPLLGASVISFRKEFIEQHPQAVKAFLAAIEDAVTRINTEPGQFSALLAEKKMVPPPLLGSYNVPRFPLKGVSSEDEWNDVLAWAKSKGLLQADVSYRDSVNPSFLP